MARKKRQQISEEPWERIKILKKHGLIKTDLRKGASAYAIKKTQRPEFAAVYAGTAQVRSAPTSKAAREYGGLYSVVGKRVIIPKSEGTVVYSKKQGGFTSKQIPLPKSPYIKPQPGLIKTYQIKIMSADGKSSRVVMTTDSQKEVDAWMSHYKNHARLAGRVVVSVTYERSFRDDD